jgi:hypothetical protein
VSTTHPIPLFATKYYPHHSTTAPRAVERVIPPPQLGLPSPLRVAAGSFPPIHWRKPASPVGFPLRTPALPHRRARLIQHPQYPNLSLSPPSHSPPMQNTHPPLCLSQNRVATARFSTLAPSPSLARGFNRAPLHHLRHAFSHPQWVPSIEIQAPPLFVS